MESDQEPKDDLSGTQYYWCVNCGHHGNFGKRRQRNLNCESCNYDLITPYELDEIMEDESLVFRFRDALK